MGGRWGTQDPTPTPFHGSMGRHGTGPPPPSWTVLVRRANPPQAGAGGGVKFNDQGSAAGPQSAPGRGEGTAAEPRWRRPMVNRLRQAGVVVDVAHSTAQATALLKSSDVPINCVLATHSLALAGPPPFLGAERRRMILNTKHGPAWPGSCQARPGRRDPPTWWVMVAQPAMLVMASMSTRGIMHRHGIHASMPCRCVEPFFNHFWVADSICGGWISNGGGGGAGGVRPGSFAARGFQSESLVPTSLFVKMKAQQAQGAPRHPSVGWESRQGFGIHPLCCWNPLGTKLS